MRKIIIIIFAILLAIIIGLLLYLWLKPEAPMIEPLTDGLLPEKVVRQDSFKKLQTVAEEGVSYYWIDLISDKVYLMKETGEIVGVTTQTISNINSVAASADGRKALVHFGYPQQPVFTIFDVQDEDWSPLPSGTIAAAWHPLDSNQLAYVQNGSLKVLDIERERTTVSMPLNIVDAVLQWPTEDKILIVDRPSAGHVGFVWEADISKRTLKKLVEANGLMINQNERWRLEFSSSPAGSNNSLFLVDAESGKRAELNFVTLPSKCVFAAENKFYCAIPQNIPDSVVLPDDYLKKSFYSQDDVYELEIDLEAGAIKARLLYSSNRTPYDATDLRATDSKLYFLNRLDQKVYSLDTSEKK